MDCATIPLLWSPVADDALGAHPDVARNSAAATLAADRHLQIIVGARQQAEVERDIAAAAGQRLGDDPARHCLVGNDRAVCAWSHRPPNLHRRLRRRAPAKSR
jgi:hypothetical protein